MKRQTTSARPEVISATLNHTTTPAPSLLTIAQFCKLEPAFTIGGIRHLLFIKGDDILGVHRFGRRVLIDPAAFISGIKSGRVTVIAGRGKA